MASPPKSNIFDEWLLTAVPGGEERHEDNTMEKIMFYNVLPAALGPAGLALGAAAAGVAIYKALADDHDRSVTVVQTSNAKRKKRKRGKKK